MPPESLTNDDWDWTVERLGGERLITTIARESKAFVRAREVRPAVALLRLTLAYCLGHVGLRATAAWAEAMGLASFSDVALLGRLRNTSEWLSRLIAQVVERDCPDAAKGRLIRLIDGTSVTKAGRDAKCSNSLWRIHAAFKLPSERFDFLELTDEKGGERIDRIPVTPGEIRIGDACYLQVDQIGEVMSKGADVLVRAGWKHARWLDENAEPFDLLALLRQAGDIGYIDQPIWLGRNKANPPLKMRLVALQKPPAAAAEARRKAHKAAQKMERTLRREHCWPAIGSF
jgi:hypothetical protein